ncbi:opioid growth factor receptor conserved region-domain-containing protein [Cytidiella melzeri]|nr:opioid growth factor receptor conserved region-domain-containing protein [Cytidiella melzeri]
MFTKRLLRRPGHSSFATMSTITIPRDVRMFWQGYPGAEDNTSYGKNLAFYSNKRRCQPDNLLISEIHESWRGDYNKLEYNHGFIQWLFPLREHGVNHEAQPLQPHEIKAMVADEGIMARVLESYRLMLDFYGMQLMSSETGLLSRSEPPQRSMERYHNIVRASHNNLRISRILKSLSELGLERLNAAFLLHILNEQSEHDMLKTATITRSMDSWWANCIRNDEERAWIGELIKRVRTDVNFEFTRDMYEQAMQLRKETGKLGFD